MIRKIHLYLGTLFASAIIFFAFSGILQIVGLGLLIPLALILR